MHRTNETIRMEIKLLGFIQVEHQDGIPLSILSHIDHLLSSLYSLPELLYSAIDIIKELTKITMACPVPNLEQLLHALSKSFCIWTCDDMQQLLEEEYNNVVRLFSIHQDNCVPSFAPQVMPLYCGSLERLCSITPSTSMLHQLEPFFCSAFHRVPPPALGPLAFKSFWGFLRDRIGPEDLQVSCPESIKACLTAFYDACGEQPPYELASKSQAQSYPNVSSVSTSLIQTGEIVVFIYGIIVGCGS